jgi:L-fucose mutarotase
MMRTPLLHPELLAALAGAGHGSQVLIADANYPASTALGPRAAVVHLNLVPGVVDAVTVLRAVCGAVPLEEARVMAPNADGPYAMDHDPEIWDEFREVLGAAGGPGELGRVERMAFYQEASGSDVAVTVVTGETRLYANLLVRIGVVWPQGRDEGTEKADGAD